MLDITVESFLWGGPIHVIASILMIIAIIRFVKISWNTRSEVSLSDIIGILSWLILALIPVFNFSLAIVCWIHIGITYMIDGMSKLDDIVVFKKQSKKL
jgi:hypothetical protein